MEMEQELQKEQKCSFYALEQLRQTAEAILRSTRQLLKCRAAVEKYRTAQPQRAYAYYLELQEMRDALVGALGDAQRNLLELEESALARKAGQLQTGLRRFDLMSRAYKPVYEVLTSFAKSLPQTDTVNAAVIGRLMNHVRMGYYPTDPGNITHILRGIAFPEGVTTNLLDPCCGCGKALRQLADGNNCYTYGMELDEHRAEEAQTRLHRVGFGSFFHSQISREAFHVLFLNPPYLSVLTEGGSRVRSEKQFLVQSIRTLMLGGLLIYIVPYYRLTPDICKILAGNFSDLSVWKFTSGEFARFHQAVVLGLRRKPTEDDETADRLGAQTLTPEMIPCVTELDEHRYVLPDVAKTVEVFRGERFNEKELERQLTRSGSFTRLLHAKSALDSTEKHPLLPLSIGQIGLIGGSGIINGLIECDTPHIIKGRIVKVKNVEREEQFDQRGNHTGAEVHEVISNKMIFNVLTPNGFLALS